MINVFSHLKKIWIIAKNELRKSKNIAKKRIIIVSSILGFLIYFFMNLLLHSGVTVSIPFYTIYTTSPIISDIVETDSKFVLVKNSGVSDLTIDYLDNIFIYSSSSDRSRSALYNFNKIIRSYNNILISDYDLNVQYPVRVDIDSIERSDNLLEFALNSDGEKLNEENNNSSISGVLTSKKEDFSSEKRESEVDYEFYSEQNKKIIGSDEINKLNVDYFENRNSNKELGLDTNFVELKSDLNKNNNMDNKNSDSTIISSSPQNIDPYNQLKSLFLVIMLTVPISMISMIYSNGLIYEKINKRGLFLLISPLSKIDILIGKTLPYLGVSYLFSVPILIKGSLLKMPDSVFNFFTNPSSYFSMSIFLKSSLIIISVFILYLAIAFICSIISRSHKELSFLSIFMVSLYSCYILIPSFMVNVSYISLASPLTLIIKLFEIESVGIDLFVFAVIPTLLSALALFIFGLSLFDDENLFSYKTLYQKIKSGISYFINKTVLNLIPICLLAVPFVFLIEVMIIVFILSIPNAYAFVILMILAAFVEEIFRNLGIYVLVKNNLFYKSEKIGLNGANKNYNKRIKKIRFKHLILFALLSGLGFFLGEKVLLLVMIAPFIDAYFTLILAGVLMPLILHSTLSFIFILFSRYVFKKKHSFFYSVFITTLIHFLINFTISMIAMKGGVN
jgi:ABC-type Na+ efflux pump permease subunit